MTRLFDVRVVTCDTFIDHTVTLLDAGDQHAAADTLLTAAERIGVLFVDGHLVPDCTTQRAEEPGGQQQIAREDRAALRLAAWQRACPVKNTGSEQLVN